MHKWSAIEQSRDAGHELRDVNHWAIVALGAGLAVALALLLGALAIVVFPLDDSLRATPDEVRDAQAAVAPWTELESIRLERRRLSEWRLSTAGRSEVDPTRVRIPIEEAMRLIVERQALPQEPAP